MVVSWHYIIIFFLCVSYSLRILKKYWLQSSCQERKTNPSLAGNEFITCSTINWILLSYSLQCLTVYFLLLHLCNLCLCLIPTYSLIPYEMLMRNSWMDGSWLMTWWPLEWFPKEGFVILKERSNLVKRAANPICDQNLLQLPNESWIYKTPTVEWRPCQYERKQDVDEFIILCITNETTIDWDKIMIRRMNPSVVCALQWLRQWWRQRTNDCWCAKFLSRSFLGVQSLYKNATPKRLTVTCWWIVEWIKDLWVHHYIGVLRDLFFEAFLVIFLSMQTQCR